MDRDGILRINEDLKSWIGADADTAKAEVQAAYPSFTVNLIPIGGIVTADYRLDRIRLTYERVDGASRICRGCVG